MKANTLLLGIIGLTVLSCKKPITEPNSGLYRGTFFEIQDNGDTTGEGVANLALNDESGWFKLVGDTATGAPLSCNGNYAILSATHIRFDNIALVDFGYHPYNFLDTTYSYIFDNHFFTMTLKVDTSLYEYKLIRN